MVTLVGRICYEPVVKRFGIHEDLRQQGIQEIEWLEIPSSVRNVGDVIHLVRGAFGIDQEIGISYMNSYLSPDLTVNVLQTGSVLDIIHVVPAIVTPEQRAIEGSIDLEILLNSSKSILPSMALCILVSSRVPALDLLCLLPKTVYNVSAPSFVYFTESYATAMHVKLQSDKVSNLARKLNFSEDRGRMARGTEKFKNYYSK